MPAGIALMVNGVAAMRNGVALAADVSSACCCGPPPPGDCIPQNPPDCGCAPGCQTQANVRFGGHYSRDPVTGRPLLNQDYSVPVNCCCGGVPVFATFSAVGDVYHAGCNVNHIEYSGSGNVQIQLTRYRAARDPNNHCILFTESTTHPFLTSQTCAPGNPPFPVQLAEESGNGYFANGIPWDTTIGISGRVTRDCHTWQEEIQIDFLTTPELAPLRIVTRTTYRLYPNCQGTNPACGVCCCNGFCYSDVNAATCAAMGGSFHPGASCLTVRCAGSGTPGTGACCFLSGFCVNGQTFAQCTASGGNWLGDGSVCGPNCPEQRGACCQNGVCTPDQTLAECTAAGGTWFVGPCNPGLCDIGACCHECLCTVTSSTLCDGMMGRFLGQGTTCPDERCTITGVCCQPQGLRVPCAFISCEECAAMGWTWCPGCTSCDDCTIPPSPGQTPQGSEAFF